MTQNSRILMAAVGAAALLAAGPAGADDRPEGWQGTWKPARGEVQRRDFKDKKAVKSLRAVWDRLGDQGLSRLPRRPPGQWLDQLPGLEGRRTVPHPGRLRDRQRHRHPPGAVGPADKTSFP